MNNSVAHGDIRPQDLSAASAGDEERAGRVAGKCESATCRGDLGEAVADLG